MGNLFIKLQREDPYNISRLNRRHVNSICIEVLILVLLYRRKLLWQLQLYIQSIDTHGVHCVAEKQKNRSKTKEISLVKLKYKGHSQPFDVYNQN